MNGFKKKKSACKVWLKNKQTSSTASLLEADYHNLNIAN
jgi:hypothetical protein